MKFIISFSNRNKKNINKPYKAARMCARILGMLDMVFCVLRSFVRLFRFCVFFLVFGFSLPGIRCIFVFTIFF